MNNVGNQAKFSFGKEMIFQAYNINAIEDDIFDYQSISLDAYIDCHCDNQPVEGWHKITCRFLSQYAGSFIQMYFIDHEGYALENSIVLPVINNVISNAINIPHNISIIRIIPMQRIGRFSLHNLEFHPISYRSAFLIMTKNYLSITPSKEVRRDLMNPMHLRKSIVSANRYQNVSEISYDQWIREYDTLTENDRKQIKDHMNAFPLKPTISILMPTYNTPKKYLIQAIDSVRNQLYPYWELCIVDDHSSKSYIRDVLQGYTHVDSRIKVIFRQENGHISQASNTALETCTGTYTALFDHDDLLADYALYMVALEINNHPQAKILYSDEDKVDMGGKRYDPYFKSDWNPELFECQNYISHLGVYKTEEIRNIHGFRTNYEGSQDYDLALRISENVEKNDIRHIPFVLYHWRSLPESTSSSVDSKPYAKIAFKKALDDHFSRTNIAADVLEIGPYFRPLIKTHEMPFVSIIIPTKNNHTMLKICIDSIVSRTIYSQYEIIIVNNQSDDEETLSYLQAIPNKNISVIDYNQEFNYSAINNYAVQFAKGTILCFLNDDTGVIEPVWLQELVNTSLRNGVGGVGAKLIYGNKTIQHAGVGLGLGGVAGHFHVGLPYDSPGYFGRASLIQAVSAVTGACFLVKKEIFEEAGSFDEHHLKVAFNDVDLCLRIGRLGYRIIFNPFSTLYHYESASRGKDDTPEKVARFKQEIDYMISTWGDTLTHDPYYNPNLSLYTTHFGLSSQPRIFKPWLTFS